jgi:hypothetical protein
VGMTEDTDCPVGEPDPFAAGLRELTPDVYARVTSTERRLADKFFPRWQRRLQLSGRYLNPQAKAARAAYMWALYSLWYRCVPIAFIGAGMVSLRANGHLLLLFGSILLVACVAWGFWLLARWDQLGRDLPDSPRVDQ